MVTVAVPMDAGAATLAACTVTVAGFGTAAGAVYKPEEEMLPAPITLQVTAVFAELSTVAVNCRVVEIGTPALDGATLTVTGGAAVTLWLTGPLVVPPSTLFFTVMGTLVPI